MMEGSFSKFIELRLGALQGAKDIYHFYYVQSKCGVGVNEVTTVASMWAFRREPFINYLCKQIFNYVFKLPPPH